MKKFEGMCDHEALIWLDFVERGFLDQWGCWPTIREVLINLREYHGGFAVEKFAERVRALTAPSAKPNQGLAARDEPWLELVPCGDRCHAWHLRLSDAGRRQLEEWNRKGCDSHWRHTRHRKRARDCRNVVPEVCSIRQDDPSRLNMRGGR